MASNNDLAMNWDEPGAALRSAYLRAGARALGGRGRQIEWQRHDVARAIYTIAGGKDGAVVDLGDLLSATELDDGQVYNALDRLEQDGAIRIFNGNCVMLLREGIDAYERSACRPYRMLERTSRGGPGLAATVPRARAVEVGELSERASGRRPPPAK